MSLKAHMHKMFAMSSVEEIFFMSASFKHTFLSCMQVKDCSSEGLQQRATAAHRLFVGGGGLNVKPFRIRNTVNNI